LDISEQRLKDGIQRQLIQLPTGTGKTAVFANLKAHHCFDNRMLVLVHREELADQAADKISHWNPSFRVGVEMGERSASNNDDVVVASVQSIGSIANRRIERFSPGAFDAVVCDEAHHAIAPTYKRVFDHFGFGDGATGDSLPLGKLLLGVTATPNRGDGQGLGQVYDEIIYRMSILDAIKDGWLSDVRGFKVQSTVDLSGVHVRAGDFATGELEAAVNVDARNHLIVQNWLVRGESRQTIAFCVDIAHAKRLADTFKAYGVSAEAIWGTDPDRREKLRLHKSGALQVLTNCGVLVEGYDDWRIGCVIMARPTKSQLLFVQMAGRGTRIPDFPDGISLLEAQTKGLTIPKKDCILMDVVDNTGRHSLVTLASLFGLGAKTDLKGKSIVYAKEKIDEALEKYPSLDVDKIETVDDIQAQVQKVELFEFKIPEEVATNSKLRWQKVSNDGYALNLPNKEHVSLTQDLLDKWNVKGTVNGNTFEIKDLPNLQEAFTQADNFVQIHGRHLLKLLRREAKWHKNTISTPQRELIKQLYKYDPQILAMIPNLSRGEASALIDKKLTKAVGVGQ
jgi:ATP-dependent helicase IRC3